MFLSPRWGLGLLLCGYVILLVLVLVDVGVGGYYLWILINMILESDAYDSVIK